MGRNVTTMTSVLKPINVKMELVSDQSQLLALHWINVTRLEPVIRRPVNVPIPINRMELHVLITQSVTAMKRVNRELVQMERLYQSMMEIRAHLITAIQFKESFIHQSLMEPVAWIMISVTALKPVSPEPVHKEHRSQSMTTILARQTVVTRSQESITPMSQTEPVALITQSVTDKRLVNQGLVPQELHFP